MSAMKTKKSNSCEKQKYQFLMKKIQIISITKNQELSILKGVHNDKITVQFYRSDFEFPPNQIHRIPSSLWLHTPDFFLVIKSFLKKRGEEAEDRAEKEK